jgi:DNA-binding beta-propeller fold protein YncE
MSRRPAHLFYSPTPRDRPEIHQIPGETALVRGDLARAISELEKATTLFGDFGGNGAGFADGTGSAAKFNVPTEMSFGPDGNLYVIDRSNHAIRRVTPGGTVTTLSSSGTLGIMRGIAVDAAGAEVLVSLSRKVRAIRSTDHGTSWSVPINIAELLSVGTSDPRNGDPVRERG